MTGEDRLAALGVVLPSPAAPLANYLPFVVSGSLLAVSGQLPVGPSGKLDPAHIGKLGVEVSSKAGQEAARLCAINILAQAKAALGDLDRISRCVTCLSSRTVWPKGSIRWNSDRTVIWAVAAETRKPHPTTACAK